MPKDFHITSSLLIQGGMIFALLDIFLIYSLFKRVSNTTFIRLKSILPFATALVYGGIWLWAAANFWHSVYGYLFPAWSRWFLPIAQLILTGVIARLAVSWALRLPGLNVLVYCLIGGLWGIVGHVLALMMGIASKPPMLHGVAAGAVIFIAFFEFTFYWGMIVSVCFLGRIIWIHLRGEV